MEEAAREIQPHMPAKALPLMMEVRKRMIQTGSSTIPRAIDEWDLKVQGLDKKFGEKLSDRMKTALMLPMIPRDLQDMMYQQAATM